MYIWGYGSTKGRSDNDLGHALDTKKNPEFSTVLFSMSCLPWRRCALQECFLFTIGFSGFSHYIGHFLTFIQVLCIVTCLS